MIAGMHCEMACRPLSGRPGGRSLDANGHLHYDMNVNIAKVSWLRSLKLTEEYSLMIF